MRRQRPGGASDYAREPTGTDADQLGSCVHSGPVQPAREPARREAVRKAATKPTADGTDGRYRSAGRDRLDLHSDSPARRGADT